MLKPIKQEKLTLSVPEAAALIGVSPAHMYELVKTEGFPAIKIGRRILVHAKRMEEWLDKMAEEGWSYE